MIVYRSETSDCLRDVRRGNSDEEIFEQIKATPRTHRHPGEAERFFETESGLRSSFYSGTICAPMHGTSVVRFTGYCFSLYMIAAVSIRGKLRPEGVHCGHGVTEFIDFPPGVMCARRSAIP